MVPRGGQGTPEVDLQEATLIFTDNSLVTLNDWDLGQGPCVCMWVSTKLKKVLLADRPGVEQGASSVQGQLALTDPWEATFAKWHSACKGTQSKTNVLCCHCAHVPFTPGRPITLRLDMINTKRACLAYEKQMGVIVLSLKSLFTPETQTLQDRPPSGKGEPAHWKSLMKSVMTDDVAK